MSRRTFTRLFRADAGVGFAEWPQQVCLLVAIERLGQGQAVTRVALDLGHAGPSAFSIACRGVLGCSPSRYAEAWYWAGDWLLCAPPAWVKRGSTL